MQTKIKAKMLAYWMSTKEALTWSTKKDILGINDMNYWKLIDENKQESSEHYPFLKKTTLGQSKKPRRKRRKKYLSC